MNKSLAVKYRPKTFDDLVEQEYIKAILLNQLKTNTTKQAYLFCGPAGDGKTTSARIFATEINNGKGKPIEIDAASNNGVDDVRQIIEDSKRKPLDSEYKVFIIDECFKGDTLITMADGVKCIKDVKVGDYIQNAVGYGKVTNVFKNSVFTNRLCCVKINGIETITTVDHLYFTDNGWVKAKDLKSGDVVYANVQVSKLWERIFQRAKISPIQVLQSSMYGSIPDTTEEGTITEKQDNEVLFNMWERISSQSFREEKNLFQTMQKQTYFDDRNSIYEQRTGENSSQTIFGANEKEQSIKKSRSCEKNVKNEGNEWDSSQLERAKRWEWTFYNSPINAIREFTFQSDIRICDCDRNEEGFGVSNLLQSRPRLSRDETCNRGGWQIPSFEKWLISGLEKNKILEQFRVDSVEVYQRGYNDELFERHFSRELLDKGELCFYDLEVNTHPSYFANGILVHNCHQFSTGAWNAMLKLLEEPPKTAIFIMCTTDPQKIPATILSRVQRFDFSKISTNGIFNRLKYICDTENKIRDRKDKIQYVDESLKLIANYAAGGMRNAITMLDKCISLNTKLTVDNVVKAIGTVDYDTCSGLLQYLTNDKDIASSISVIDDIYNSGVDLKQFFKTFQGFIIDVINVKLFKSFDSTILPETGEMLDIINTLDYNECADILDLIIDINSNVRWETDIKNYIKGRIIVYLSKINL